MIEGGKFEEALAHLEKIEPYVFDTFYYRETRGNSIFFLFSFFFFLGEEVTRHRKVNQLIRSGSLDQAWQI